MATETKVSWPNKAPEDLTRCFSRRCRHVCVENRLCAVHNAAWLAAGHQPPMPAYGKKAVEKSDLKEIEEVVDATMEEIATAPLRSTEDLETFRATADSLKSMRVMVSSSLEAKTKPFEEYALKIKKAHELPRLKVNDALKMLEHRIKEFERTSLRPPAPEKKAGGR